MAKSLTKKTVPIINVSVILTIKNEENSIISLLESLTNQTKKPGEIIIVDAGSTDHTLPLITQYKSKQLSSNIIIVNQANSTRSKGRNIAISKAKFPYIAVIDAGCEAEPNWLLELTTPLNLPIQAVAGYYLPIIEKPIQQIFALYLCVMSNKLNINTYLPSSRSLIFSKKLYLEIGKYPEHLNTCEDLVFAKKLKQTQKMQVNPNAIVYWRMPRNLSEFYNKINNYAKGDIEAKYLPHILSIITIYARYGLFILFPLLFPFYLIFPLYKHARHVSSYKLILLLPLVQLTADLAVITGSMIGLKNLLTPNPHTIVSQVK